MRPLKVRLCPWESRRLRILRHQVPSTRVGRRAMCLLASAAGQPAMTIAHVTGLSPNAICIILEQLKENDRAFPVIVGAGVGTASDVAVAMELGVDGVLLNTAIAGAKEPVAMAHAMKYATIAGHLAASAGRIPRKLYATASSPWEGRINA